jgi:uncharacterized protein
VSAFLLDVNVVLALVDPAHQHHRLASEWFRSEAISAFATCPIVENGVLRVASSTAYPNRPGDVDTVRDVLARLYEQPGHFFWPDSISLVETLPQTTGLTSRQVTDCYLVALAQANNGRLATFHRSIPTAAAGVKPESVLVLGA